MIHAAFLYIHFFVATANPNPWGPFPFQTEPDCRMAARLIIGQMTAGRVVCKRPDGEVFAEWTQG